MAKVKFTPEQIVIKLREVEELCGKGSSIAEAVRQILPGTIRTFLRTRQYHELSG